MNSLPQPDDLTSLVLRTDLSDDTTWEGLQVAIADSSAFHDATYVSDSADSGVTIQALSMPMPLPATATS